MRRAERDGAGEIIHRLRNDAGPVDRVHAGEADALAKRRVAEQTLENVLRIIERSVERDDMNIVVFDRRHLSTLHIRHATVRIEDEHIDAIQSAKRFNRGGARIARGCANNGRAQIPLLQHIIHHAAEQLHRQIFKGERRSVE